MHLYDNLCEDRLRACYPSMTETKWFMPPWQRAIWSPEYIDSLCFLCRRVATIHATMNNLSLILQISFPLQFKLLLSESCIKPWYSLIFLSIETFHSTILFLMWFLSSNKAACVCVCKRQITKGRPALDCLLCRDQGSHTYNIFLFNIIILIFQYPEFSNSIKKKVLTFPPNLL